MLKKSKLAIIFISSLLVLLFFLVSLKSNIWAQGFWQGSWSSIDLGGPWGTLRYEGDDSEPDSPNEANIYIYGDAGYYAADEQQCINNTIVNNTIAVFVSDGDGNDKENLNGSPWLCDGSSRPYYSFKAWEFAGSRFDIYSPINTSCDEVKVVVPDYGCVIFRRASGSTCIQEGGCSSGYDCGTILSRVFPDWSTNRCILNAPYFVADATIYAKTSAIPTPTPTPTSTPTPTPTPTPPLCPTGTLSSPVNNYCSGRNLSLSASYSPPANNLQFVVDDSSTITEGEWIWNGEEFLWTPSPCDSGWSSSTSYSSCTINTTDTYYWGIRTKNTDPSQCRVPSPHNFSPQRTIGVDVTAPTHTQATASYNESTEQITFSWDSSDVGCGACSSKACNYWLQGKWTDEISGVDVGGWVINNGSWTPASYISPSYTGFSCTGNEGLTAKLLIRRANDSIPNYSSDLGENFLIAGTFTCPAPAPSLSTLIIGPDNDPYEFSGTRWSTRDLEKAEPREPDHAYYENGESFSNSIQITQNVVSNLSGGGDDNIALSGFAFVSESLSCGASCTLSDLMSSADSSDGFVALYVNYNKGQNYIHAGKTFEPEKFYVYFDGSWSTKYEVGDWLTMDKIQVEFTVANIISPEFDGYFFKAMGGNKVWDTYGYTRDYYNGEDIIEKLSPSAP